MEFCQTYFKRLLFSSDIKNNILVFFFFFSLGDTSLHSCLLADNCVPFVCKTSLRYTPFGQKSDALSAENPIVCMRL
ncbi:hypothetical protein AB205_0161660 [Aquarana catesbeiana]|uniref:Uncharacterized protein n=1 Tax=Aquarana catesbeiana TaxID=8400 RepID=A0A2G9SJ72_AQUCT|nr:hypothetical protein AB205_0161660 [Aquarana catesbeiana]